MKISFGLFNLLFTLLTIGVYHFYFLTELYRVVPLFWFIMTVAIIFAIYLCAHTVIFWPKTLKVLATILILFNGICGYFMSAYHIVFNKTMLRNVLDTNVIEATEWMGISFWIYVVVACLIPLVLIWKCRIVFAPIRTHLKRSAALLVLTGLLTAGLALPHRVPIKIFLKENFNLRYMLLPSSYISSAIGLVKLHFQDVDLIDTTRDLTEARYWNPDKKMLIVFVLGESARYQSYPLTATARTTGPLKSYLPEMTVLRETQACGVETHVSVPCLFSGYRRTAYHPEAALNTPNILDILQSKQWQMLWLDNEMGCNKVCRNIPTHLTCHSRDCTDNVLNERLTQVLPTLTTDSFIVLHQRGSHGPRYDLRTPEKYRLFRPYCTRADVQNCTAAELNNAYDNSLYYTSVLLADLMDDLNRQTDHFYPIMIYISDHGESLGEGGFYAHSADYRIAPPEQKQVPFFIWIPTNTAQELNVNRACLNAKATMPASQDMIFHTLMGMAGLRSAVYDVTLDLTAGCIGQ